MQFSLIVFMLLLVGIVLLIDLPYKRIFEKRPAKVNMSKVVLVQKRRRVVDKKQSQLEKHQASVLRAIEAAHVKLTWAKYMQLLIICALIGAGLGMLFDNAILSLVMACCLPILPKQILVLKGMSYSRELHSQIEDSLGIITNTYMQTADIRNAIESSLRRIEQPLKGILSDCANEIYLGGNAVVAISHMRNRIDNRQWTQWCDLLIQCQSDRGMRVLLPPMIAQLSAMRGIQAELDTTMANIWREHLIVSGIVVASIPFMMYLNVEWYNLLMNTLVGKIVVCLVFVTVFVATMYVLKVNKPISTMEV